MLVDGVEQEVTTTEKPGGKQPETISLTKTEHAALIRERDEARESERYWATRARGGKEDAPPPEDDAIDTDGLVPESTGNEDLDRAIFEDPEKWTEAITKGPKAIGQYIKSLGLVTGAEAAEIAVKAARQVVESKVQGMQVDAKLGEFADLKDQESELFQKTAPIYREMVADNGGKQSSALMLAAARIAKAEMKASAPKPKVREEDDVYDRYDEDDRKARVAAQGGNRGRAAAADDTETDSIGPQARELIRQMNSGGGPQITEEDFMASRKEIGARRRSR